MCVSGGGPVIVWGGNKFDYFVSEVCVSEVCVSEVCMLCI